MLETRFKLGSLVLVLGLLWASGLGAQTVRIESRTIAKGTQFRRADFSVEAKRLFTQSLSVWGWNAAPGFVGTVDVHASARYLNDFGLRTSGAGNPFIETERSRFLLDVAEVRWRPIDRVRLTVGRQWVASPLGVRDVDGVRLRISPQLSPEVRGHVDAFAGYTVASGYRTINSDAWDIQGLPVTDDGSAPDGRRYGVSTGLRVGETQLDLAWQRRDGETTGGADYLGEERIGAALSGNIVSRVALTTGAAYNLLLDGVDRAEVNVAWREPAAGSVLSGGLEHRRPWFDSNSIFNVFGARPYDGAYAVYQLPVASLRTSFEARTWARAYDANFVLSDFGGGADDARAFGAGLGHTTRFDAFRREWVWKSFGSWQTSEERAQGGTQWLGDTRFRVPVLRNDVTVEGRFLGLRSVPGATSLRGPGGALTAVFTSEIPTSFGTFAVSVEGQTSTFYGANMNAYASFGSELWL